MGRTATPLYLTQILLEVKLQIILLERIEKLGQMGDVVNVRPGFARNFLLPQKNIGPTMIKSAKNTRNGIILLLGTNCLILLVNT